MAAQEAAAAKRVAKAAREAKRLHLAVDPMIVRVAAREARAAARYAAPLIPA